MPPPRFVVVMLAINLDCQPGRNTEEIQHIRADWMLTAKAQSFQLSIAQDAPQQAFRQAGVGP